MNHQNLQRNHPKWFVDKDAIKILTSSSSEQTSLHWASLCHNPDPNSALEYFLKIVEKLLDNHAPYENIKHQKSQFEIKPWITPGLACSIVKSKIQKFLEGKRSTQKRKL